MPTVARADTPQISATRTDEAPMTHPVLSSGRIAVITGGASGIGLAAAKHFASLGLQICIADREGEHLSTAAEEVSAAGAPDVLAVPTDVGSVDEVRRLEE